MKINDLKHYPRFVFNCSDGYGFSTTDLEHLTHFRNDNDVYPITSFKIGDILTIKRSDLPDPVKYKVSNVEIRDIRYDTDESLYGVYDDDRAIYNDRNKFTLMAIFVFLETVK